MSISKSANNVPMVRLVPGDDDFCLVSGHAYYPRANIVISTDCPREYRSMIVTAMSKGWLSAEAWVKESEYMWEKLGK